MTTMIMMSRVEVDKMILEDNDLPIPSFSPDNTLDNADFHEGMIFEGEDFNVNFRRNIPINARHRDFQDGAVREIVYNVNFDQSWNNVALGEVIGDLLNVFQAIIDKLKECYNPSDLVRFYISNRAFNAPRNLGLMPLKDMNVGQVEMYLRTILQSDENIFLDETLEIQVAVVRNPQGTGKKDPKKGHKIPRNCNPLMYIFGQEDALKLSRSISKTKVEDNLCLARSVVVALARIDKQRAEDSGDKKLTKKCLNKIKQLYNVNRDVLRKEAEKLQILAGFPLSHIPSFTDIAAFERAVNARIIVFQAGTDTTPVYVGKEDMQRTLYLFYVKSGNAAKSPGHFHAITNINGIFNGSTFCKDCMACFKKKNKHSCYSKCLSCGRKDCVIVEEEKKTCTTCNRHLNSKLCFDGHIVTGVCAASHRCKECGIFYKPSVEHRCGQRICKICLKWVSGVHYCYIRRN